MGIFWDSKDFKAKSKDLEEKMKHTSGQAVRNIASEVLRLSQFQVPHDKGSLQNSGHVEDEPEQSIVGYNTVYAARLHEHPEYQFQKGRKAKYLEDPIKSNLSVFLDYYKKFVGGLLGH